MRDRVRGAIYFVDIKQGRPSLSLRSAGAALRVGYGVAQTALWQTGAGPCGPRHRGLKLRAPSEGRARRHRGLTCALQQVDADHAASASAFSASPAAAARDCGFERGVTVRGRYPGPLGAAGAFVVGSDHAARRVGGGHSSGFG